VKKLKKKRKSPFAAEMCHYQADFEEITAETIFAFLQNVLDGKYPRLRLAQEVYCRRLKNLLVKPPEDWDKGPVKILTAKNFYQVVNGSKTVFVDFCELRYFPKNQCYFSDTDWCGPCKEMAPDWMKLGEKYNDNPDLVVAKVRKAAEIEFFFWQMEADINELEHLVIGSYPTLRFFPKAIECNGPRTIEAWTTFIEKEAKVNRGEDADDKDKVKEKKIAEKVEEMKEPECKNE